MLTDEQLEDLIEIGHIARMLKMRSESESIFRSLAAVFPDRGFPHTGLAFLYLDDQRYGRACGEFVQALSIVDDPSVRAWYATALHCQKQYKEAGQQLNKVLSATMLTGSHHAAREIALRLSQFAELRPFINKEVFNEY